MCFSILLKYDKILCYLWSVGWQTLLKGACRITPGLPSLWKSEQDFVIPTAYTVSEQRWAESIHTAHSSKTGQWQRFLYVFNAQSKTGQGNMSKFPSSNKITFCHVLFLKICLAFHGFIMQDSLRIDRKRDERKGNDILQRATPCAPRDHATPSEPPGHPYIYVFTEGT